ncbi:MAG TPA: hypothetical protein VFE58_00630 [Tepidisphaeraceae bacterium]|nr:hypothetical protein [Tepidisphaeraceae bacterium]
MPATPSRFRSATHASMHLHAYLLNSEGCDLDPHPCLKPNLITHATRLDSLTTPPIPSRSSFVIRHFP